MRLLLADALLVLSLLFVRPVAERGWPARLWLHGLLLAAGLLAALAGGAGVVACLAGMVAALLPPALLSRALRAGARDTDGVEAVRMGRDAAWLLGGLLLVALAMRLLPATPTGLAPLSRGLLSAALGILLTGLLGACRAGPALGRAGSLLLAGNGLLLVACQVPGLDLPLLASLLLLQGGLLVLAMRAARDGDVARDDKAGA